MHRLVVTLVGVILTMLIPTISVNAEVGRPSDLDLTAPGSDIPQTCAAFFSPTGWGKGSWNGNREGELWVEKIRPDCSATVVYGWGGYKEWGPGYKRVKNAQIKNDGKLYVPLIFSSMEAEAVFTLIDGGKRLQGHWYRTDGSKDTADVVFENSVHNAPQLSTSQ